MGIISQLFSKSGIGRYPPWTDESAFAAIRANLDPVSGKLSNSALPDDELQATGKRIRFAPGALDGVFGHHGGPGDERVLARRVAKHLDRVARTNDATAAGAAYQLLKDESVLAMIDDVIATLRELGTPPAPHLEDFALQLATKSRDRGPVKTGIALLGAVGSPSHQEVVQTLGLHDEFTLYAAVALTNMLPEPAAALWQLARRVDGWGRIQLVERIGATDDPEIQKWLRTEGYRNSILYDYLALAAATHGQLRHALEQNVVSEPDLIAAGELIGALICADGGAAEGMNSYSDAATACSAFLSHIPDDTTDLRHFLTARAIGQYVDDDQRDVGTRLKCGWTETSCELVKTSVESVTRRPEWRAAILAGLDSDDGMLFYRADHAAAKLGIDTFDWHWRRLQQDPENSSNWFYVMRGADSKRIDRIVAFAAQAIPLHTIATGPADEMGLGPDFRAHSCLDFVLQDLHRFTGKGVALIRAGLRSPVVRNRTMALKALDSWQVSDLAELRDLLITAKNDEVDDELRSRIQACLARA